MSRPKGSPKTPGSGRQKGTPNRATVQRRLLFGEGRRADGTPLAKEVLEESMLHYLRLANACAPPENGKWDKGQEKLFHRYREAADLRARWLAPYQSPQFRSITVQPPREKPVAGTSAIDALEAMVLSLARVRRIEAPPQPMNDITPADNKDGNGKDG